ncbi:MAG: hypothetical protein K0R41_384 [Geminicoccaceae bacterium]|jgi:hypothetical protein|nr:hypothetical protein [Geminicoccaceae bacterium]
MTRAGNRGPQIADPPGRLVHHRESDLLRPEPKRKARDTAHANPDRVEGIPTRAQVGAVMHDERLQHTARQPCIEGVVVYVLLPRLRHGLRSMSELCAAAPLPADPTPTSTAHWRSRPCQRCA